MTENAGQLPLRSPLGRVRGLGSARGGTQSWWLMRISSMALLPLTLWFIVSAALLAGAPLPEVRGFIAAPWNTVLLLSLVVLAFHHTALGLQEVLEDYVHDETPKVFGILAVKTACWVLALAAVLAVLRIALTA
jgi:succinate dehydrogenase / fumarate reductase membrane anchor subunit